MNQVNDDSSEPVTTQRIIHPQQQPHEAYQNSHNSYHIHGDKFVPSQQHSDLEAGMISQDLEDKSEAILRMGFIRKVYGILSLQLLMTTLFVGFAFEPIFNLFLYNNIGLFYVAMMMNIAILLSMVCVPSLLRTVPTNYILLFVWTFCEGYMVATVAAFNPPEIVLTAAGLTALVSVALTVYAFTTKTDFTFLGGFLFVMTFIMLFWGILTLIFGFFFYTVYCVLGVMLFSIYLIFDTQLILGKFGLQYSIDDYILASINIYIDIIQLFLYILQLLRRD